MVWRLETPSGETVSLGGKKAGELLAYLALHQGHGHSREKLATMLWGNSVANSGRTRLRQEIAALRALFPADVDEHPLLHVTSGELRIGANSEIDAVSFLDLYLEGKTSK